MEEIVIKKQTYKVIKELNSVSYLVSLNDKQYVAYDFSDNFNGFDDFRFAVKRLKNCGLTMPNVLVVDKKNYRFLVEYIDGPTIEEMLIEDDLEEKIIEQAFILNYKARINGVRLDFNPRKFRCRDGVLYYIPFTFTSYIRAEDFSQKEIRYWFYTNDFVEYCISNGIPVNKNRLLGEYERNKQIVLTVVKYFR